METKEAAFQRQVDWNPETQTPTEAAGPRLLEKSNQDLGGVY